MTSMAGGLRQLYVELVRRRARVRVVHAAMERTDARPIFILGVYRSGTTLLRYALDSHPNIACPPETNFLQHFGPLLADPRAMYGLDSMGFDQKHVTTTLRDLCNYYYDNYAASQQKSRWADKTPLYVGHLGLLQDLFPDAQYIIIHRHPLDQIDSHTKGGTFLHEPLAALHHEHGDLRIAGAHYWTAQTNLLLKFSQEVSTEVIRYEDLCADPMTVLNRVLKSVGEPWSDQVLDFHGHPHDQGMEASKIQRIRGFKLQSGNYRSWDSETVKACSDIVRETASRVSYEV